MLVLVTLALLAPSCYQTPVAAPISRPFVEPACEYCAGHRVIEYAVDPGTVVSAIATGTVAFAGVVVGDRFVTVRQDDGMTATYGSLARSALSVGDRVTAGTAIGTSTDRFMLSLRRDGRYIDPTPLLRRLVGRPRLVPLDGSAGRPPKQREGCDTAGETVRSAR